MAADEAKSTLVVIIDTNQVWWGQRIVRHERDLLFSQCLDSILVFCNSHLMMGPGNKLAVISAHTNSSKFLFPKQLTASAEVEGESNHVGSNDGKYELFSQIDKVIIDEIKDLVLNESDGEVFNDSVLAGAMSMALCYIHRLERESKHVDTLSSRILVIKCSEDNPLQYMNFMNVVFTAQKQNVVVDACVLDNESGLLQQACDITGGIYLKLPQLGGMLQYLLWAFLPDPTHRTQLSLPPRVQVDYRAACFCHRNLIDIGYVCSVCLSIFCTFSPICSTCQTTFKFLGPPKAKKKSKSKS